MYDYKIPFIVVVKACLITLTVVIKRHHGGFQILKKVKNKKLNHFALCDSKCFFHLFFNVPYS